MLIIEIKINLHVLSVSIPVLMLTREPKIHYLLVHVFFPLINVQYGMYLTQCKIFIEYLYKRLKKDKLSMLIFLFIHFKEFFMVNFSLFQTTVTFSSR